MSDASTAKALRSGARLVVIEAPAGCGKTFQAAGMAADCAAALSPGKMLILTHTHAACDVIANRAPNTRAAEIRTIDSLLVQIANAYHRAIDLPPDVSAWARQRKDGYDQIAARVGLLLTRTPSVAAALAARYPVVLCDEHQDSSPHQHGVVMRLHEAGARLRIFGDPMQSIYARKEEFSTATEQWTNLCKAAETVEQLDVGHRWIKSAPELGEWIQAARATLRDGACLDLRGKLPKGLVLIRAENHSKAPRGYQLDGEEREPIDRYLDDAGSLLVLATQNKTVSALRAIFARRLPIWEGHTRGALDALVRKVSANTGKPAVIGGAVTAFLGGVGIGFAKGSFGQPLANEIAGGCAGKKRGRPAAIQELARLILQEPNHRGVANVLRKIEELAANHKGFAALKIDHPREFREAIHLGEFEDMSRGHSELSRRRASLRPAPAKKSLSTVHKAKGLECDRVLVLPCDAGHFTDKPEHRCLLYVALSRPVRELALIVPQHDPSPLLVV